MKRFARLLLLGSLPALAHLCAQETQLQADLRREAAGFGDSCLHPKGSLFGALGGCADVLFTGEPLHIAVGSLAPGNGFGAGLAFVTHYTPNENWRLSWDADAIATPNNSWRAGAYMTAVLIRHPNISVLPGTAAGATRGPRIQEMPAFHLYAQSTSLNQLAYFGLGPDASRADESHFGMRETIIGANVAWPVYAPLGLSLFGEANGRLTDLRLAGDSGPPISQVFTSVTAPGLGSAQPAYAQFGEGVRLNPEFAGGHVRLDYSIGFQEWASGDQGHSFRRFTADLSHSFPLYRGMRSLKPQEFNGPDSCRQSATAKDCPPVTRNLEGSFGFRFLYTASFIPGGNTVPFYLDPTLGGSGIDGNSALPSYADYRFRGPHLLLIRGSFEHSIYKWPIGVKVMVDEGRVALTRGDLGFDHLAHSYAAGLTVHAGGLPVLDLLFAWGGSEGTHTLASVGSSLLGGGARPPLD